MTEPSTPAQRKADRRAYATLAAAMIGLFVGPVVMAQAFYATPDASVAK